MHCICVCIVYNYIGLRFYLNSQCLIRGTKIYITLLQRIHSCYLVLHVFSTILNIRVLNLVMLRIYRHNYTLYLYIIYHFKFIIQFNTIICGKIFFFIDCHKKLLYSYNVYLFDYEYGT